MTVSLDLGIVADRYCATSRTYLTYLAATGFRVKLVLLVDFIPAWRDSGLLGVSWLTAGSKARKQKAKLPPRAYDDSFVSVCNALQADFPMQVDYFAPFDFSRATDSLVEFTATGYDDPDLQARLTQGDVGCWLYTNGGRVPEGLLEKPAFKMLHIHPGVVPFVKGSDGLLWSVLTRGRPGMSCFYMNAGIDTGDIIATKEYPFPAFSRRAAIVSQEEELLYRGLLHSFDPHLRADLLLDVVSRHSDGRLDQLACNRQDPTDGRTYYWMHDAIKRHALKRILGG